MADDISKVTPFWQWKEQQEARDTKENGGTPLLRSKDWYHREYGVFVQSSKRLGYATFENGKLRVDVGSFLKDNADRLESATTPAEPTLAEIERAVATLPPGYAFADALEHTTPAGIAANIPNPLLDPIQGPATTPAEVDAPGIDTANHAGVRVRGYTVEQYATLARQLAEAKAESDQWERDYNALSVRMLQLTGHAAAAAGSALAAATRRLGEVEGLVRDALTIQQMHYGDGMGTHLALIGWARDANAAIDARLASDSEGGSDEQEG